MKLVVWKNLFRFSKKRRHYIIKNLKFNCTRKLKWTKKNYIFLKNKIVKFGELKIEKTEVFGKKLYFLKKNYFFCRFFLKSDFEVLRTFRGFLGEISFVFRCSTISDFPIVLSGNNFNPQRPSKQIYGKNRPIRSVRVKNRKKLEKSF